MFQTIVIVGHLGRDPEMRYMPNGDAVTSFNVATNHVYTGTDGQRVEETTWFRVSTFRKQAENCNQYLKKGSSVLVEGRLKSDPVSGGPKIWTRQDGSPGASFEIIAQNVKFLTRAGGSTTPGGGEYSEGPLAGGEDEIIPF